MSEKTHWRGAKLLSDWRENAELTQQAAADLIGIDLARYNAFENDRARPGLDWAVTIEDVTNGKVPAKSWTEEKRARAAS
jgi:DNA-binding XRE family transcriptional regulator